MAVTLPLTPQGLVASRNRRASSPTYQANRYKVKKGYATAIGIGDVVAYAAGSTGYIILAPDGATQIVGVFAGVLAPPGYYDLSAQQTMYGLNGSWPTTANPSDDVDVLVYDDPDMMFRAQVSGGPWVQAWAGQNVDWVHGNAANGNGSPNASGVSTLALSGASVATTNTLPLKIQEICEVAPFSGSISGGGVNDPSVTNPWVMVTLNFGFSPQQQATGV